MILDFRKRESERARERDREKSLERGREWLGTWMELLRTRLRTEPRFCVIASWWSILCPTFPPFSLLGFVLGERAKFLIVQPVFLVAYTFWKTQSVYICWPLLYVYTNIYIRCFVTSSTCFARGWWGLSWFLTQTRRCGWGEHCRVLLSGLDQHRRLTLNFMRVSGCKSLDTC